jgi:dimethylhistidine N-methyltransferase
LPGTKLAPIARPFCPAVLPASPQYKLLGWLFFLFALPTIWCYPIQGPSEDLPMIRQLTKSSCPDRAQFEKIKFQADAIAGLSANPKRLSCKYFYDKRGSALFDAICHLDEYYLTRTELEIMRKHAPAITQAIGQQAMLVEFGSGSSVKTRLLLDQLENPVYVPVDISRKHLEVTARRLSRLYPQIAIQPVCADFTKDFQLPAPQSSIHRRVVYFPGSTIGNFERADAAALLNRIAELCGRDGGLLIGIDLQKDVSTIEAAYNDALGITSQFNLNILRRINRELGGKFDLQQFEHLAFYDRAFNRIDIRLVSRCNQQVEIGSHTFDFHRGEAIHTEYSHKYTVEQFEQIAAAAGFRLHNYWTDERRYFAVLYFQRQPKR